MFGKVNGIFPGDTIVKWVSRCSCTENGRYAISAAATFGAACDGPISVRLEPGSITRLHRALTQRKKLLAGMIVLTNISRSRY